VTDPRFTPPWDIEDNSACFTVRITTSRRSHTLYYEEEPVNSLTRDEARRIALKIAELLELLRRPEY
jgi:hypothetical protein